MTVTVADTGDIHSIEKYKPRDATTNPSLITAAAQMPEYARSRRRRARVGAGEGAARHKVIGLAIDRLAVEFGLRILGIVPGRVSTEVDARLSFDTPATVEQGRATSSQLYEAGGIVARAHPHQDRVDLGGHPRRRDPREGGHPLQPHAALRHAPGHRLRRGRRHAHLALRGPHPRLAQEGDGQARAIRRPRIRACCR